MDVENCEFPLLDFYQFACKFGWTRTQYESHSTIDLQILRTYLEAENAAREALKPK